MLLAEAEVRSSFVVACALRADYSRRMPARERPLSTQLEPFGGDDSAPAADRSGRPIAATPYLFDRERGG